MFLRRLNLKNYGIFADADFDFATNTDQPLVLVSGNNGAGKTSLLEALRVALHGRRAFDVPLAEHEYLLKMKGRLRTTAPAPEWSVLLDFDYVDLHKTRQISVTRSWAIRGQRVSESLVVTQDGVQLPSDVAADLLTTIVPPEIARYFFFDGERIRELAEWDDGNEGALFDAVSDLLGLGILSQLRVDLLRLSATEDKQNRTVEDAAVRLERAENDLALALTMQREARMDSRSIKAAADRARAEVKRVGALQQEEIAAIETELAELGAERRVLVEEAHRASGDILPLLCARTLRERFSKETEARRKLEDMEIVSSFLEANSKPIIEMLREGGFKGDLPRRTLQAVQRYAQSSSKPVSVSLPNLSRSDANWMQRVIEHELPEMLSRSRTLCARLRAVETRMDRLQDMRRSVPVNDPAGDAALSALEDAQRSLVYHEAKLAALEQRVNDARRDLELARDDAKAQRVEAFRDGKLRERDRVTNRVLEALPILADRLKASKERRFGEYLGSALGQLWHKTGRLTGVDVSFSDRLILLQSEHGELMKQDLSAGEKQLFATAFIYALARLSGRQMPFVIDTPLGRLDRLHRQRFVAEFLPNASHQVILLSTDTEIVGSLYEDVRPLLAHHHELAEYNGNATEPVQIAIA